jgi:hypothetical protein
MEPDVKVLNCKFIYWLKNFKNFVAGDVTLYPRNMIRE